MKTKIFEVKENIIKLLKSRLESSSFIILPNIYRSDYVVLKLTWLLFFFVSTGFCAWFISRSITDYLNFDVISKTEIKYDTNLIFPVITICNSNPLTTDYSIEFVRSLLNTSNPYLRDDFMVKFFVNYNITKNLTDPYLFGQKINELIIGCKFGFSDCNLNEDFEHYYDFNYGNCYRFNSGKNMIGKIVEQKRANALYGSLDIQFWVGQAQNNYNMFSINNGLIIFISNQSINSQLSNGIGVSAGYSTQVSVEKLTINKMPKPYSNCVANLNQIDSYESLTFKKLVEQDTSLQTYNYMNCYLVCLQRHVGDLCGCQLDSLTVIYYNKMKICYSNESLREKENKCFAKSLTLFLNDSKPFLDICDCPIECDYNIYKYSTSLNEYPTRKYFSYLMNNQYIKSKFNGNLNDSLESYESLRKSVGRVKIYYEFMMETIITEYAKTQVADLVACVGGIMGLFLGLSFLSFVEFIDLLIQLIAICFKRSKSVNKIQVKEFQS